MKPNVFWWVEMHLRCQKEGFQSWGVDQLKPLLQRTWKCRKRIQTCRRAANLEEQGLKESWKISNFIWNLSDMMNGRDSSEDTGSWILLSFIDGFGSEIIERTVVMVQSRSEKNCGLDLDVAGARGYRRDQNRMLSPNHWWDIYVFLVFWQLLCISSLLFLINVLLHIVNGSQHSSVVKRSGIRQQFEHKNAR